MRAKYVVLALAMALLLGLPLSAWGAVKYEVLHNFGSGQGRLGSFRTLWFLTAAGACMGLPGPAARASAAATAAARCSNWRLKPTADGRRQSSTALRLAATARSPGASWSSIRAATSTDPCWVIMGWAAAECLAKLEAWRLEQPTDLHRRCRPRPADGRAG